MKETDLVELLKAGAPVAVWAEERFAMRVLQLDTPCDTFMLLDRSRKVEKSIAVDTVREVLVQDRALEVCRNLGISDPHLSEKTSLVLVHGDPRTQSAVCAFLVDDVEKQTALQKCLEYVAATAPRKMTENGTHHNGARRPDTEDELPPGAPRDLEVPRTAELKKKEEDKAWEVWDRKGEQEEKENRKDESCSDRMCENTCTIS
jgi:hypothetical protein